MRPLKQAFFEFVDFNNLRVEFFEIRDYFTRGMTFINVTIIPRVNFAICLVDPL